jgi:hypothetical protein
LPRKTIDQKDICPDDICSERYLPRKTIAQMTFDKKDICSGLIIVCTRNTIQFTKIPL